jgi:putative membrane protein
MKLMVFPIFPRRRNRRKQLRRAALTGVAAGLAGAFAMSQFSGVWERLFPASAGRPRGVAGLRPVAAETRRRLMHASQQEWDSTLNTAGGLARNVLDRPLTQKQRERGAVAVHYAVGAAAGAGYAVLHDFFPEAGLGAGALFGAGLWLLAEEIGMPVLHLSAWPRQYSAAMQVNSLGEHVAYGMTTELLRRALRRRL